jgi:glycosyltransferase involved in cell wall biosynthesis
MNIGVISQALPYLPSKGGFRLYGANLIRCLSRRHRVDLVSLLLEDDAEHLEWARRHCASVTTIPTNRASLWLRTANFASSYLWGAPLHYRAAIGAILRAGLRSQHWDVLHAEGPFAAGLIPVDLPIPKILSAHDSSTLRCHEMLKCVRSLRERLYYWLLRRHTPRYERLVYPRFNRCVVVAARDLEAVQQIVPDASVVVIPYGIDVDHFRPLAVRKDPATLIFHGHLGYAPNIAAALELANRILPLVRERVPTATLHLVAADPVPEIRRLAARPDIRLTISPPDVRPALCSAAVYVSAVRHGTGMKNKILEAMALRLPIVCYQESAAGIRCQPGRHLLLARDPDDFAEQVVGLVQDRLRAESIAAAGRRLMEQQYSWELRARSFEELYEEVILEQRPPASASRLPATCAGATTTPRSQP